MTKLYGKESDKFIIV